MADPDAKPKKWYQSTKALQLIAAAVTFLGVLALAYCKKWPFHQEPVDLGANPSIWETLLNDRLTLGLLRAGLAAVVTYAVVSVPALVVGGRWMKGLTTTGVTADEAESADEGIEALQQELQETRGELQDFVEENDLLSQWVLQLRAELDEAAQGGGEEGGEDGEA